MFLSAAAMSGRRSRSSEGTPAGMAGTFRASGAAGMEKVEAGLPIKVAMACSSWARCTPRSMAWAWVFLILGFGQGNVVPGGDAAGVTVFGPVEDFFEGGRFIVQEAFLLIQGAQLEIALGQGGLGAQAHPLQVGGAGLGAGLAGLHAAAHLAPDVQFPGGVEVQQVVR